MKAYRIWNKLTNKVFYVSDLPKKPEDWGYTDKAEKALDLSPYWCKRFSAHCKRCNDIAKFV